MPSLLMTQTNLWRTVTARANCITFSPSVKLDLQEVWGKFLPNTFTSEDFTSFNRLLQFTQHLLLWLCDDLKKTFQRFMFLTKKLIVMLRINSMTLLNVLGSILTLFYQTLNGIPKPYPQARHIADAYDFIVGKFIKLSLSFFNLQGRKTFQFN